MSPDRKTLRQGPELQRIAAMLKMRRKELGLTQEQAAFLCGCAPKYFSMIENLDRILSLPKFLHILDKMGMRLEIRDADPAGVPDDLDLLQAAESLTEHLVAFVQLLKRHSGAD